MEEWRAAVIGYGVSVRAIASSVSLAKVFVLLYLLNLSPPSHNGVALLLDGSLKPIIFLFLLVGKSWELGCGSGGRSSRGAFLLERAATLAS